MLPVAGLLLATALGGCSDKSSAAAMPDAAAMLHKGPLDGGADAAVTSTADAGVLDDAAMPASSGEDLEKRMRHLLEAIAQDNGDLANDALFPREAYVATRDVSDPHKVWDKKVSAIFKRSVERTHARMKGISQAKFVSFELGHAIVQLTPKKKDFKKPLWRVKHSKLTFTIDGKTRHLDINEMTAWRGAWYVTKLR